MSEYYAVDPEDKDKLVCFNEGLNFMEIISNSDEIEIFDSQNIKDVI